MEKVKVATIEYIIPGTRVLAKDYHSKARDMKPGTIINVQPSATNKSDGSVSFSLGYEVLLDRKTANGKKVYVHCVNPQLIEE